MVRIVGTNIPDEKRIAIALTYIYGIGRNSAKKILQQLKINPDTRVKDLSKEDFEHLRGKLEEMNVEGELRMMVSQNIKYLKEINSYRGLRHKRNLPVRGQRTKTNARTKRGKKMTVGSGRKKTAEKT